MRKPKRIRMIYAELREVLGPSVPASDLLKVANVILRAYNTDVSDSDGFGRPGFNRSIVSLPLDEAIADGGWRVLEFEQSERPDSFHDKDFSFILKLTVTSFLGAGWQHGCTK